MTNTFDSNDVINSVKDHLLPCFNDLNEFEIIFTGSDLQNEMLDITAPNFFWTLQEMYFDRFILAISRLLDPAKQFGFENTSMFRLIEVVKPVDEVLYIQLNLLIEKLKQDSSDIIKLRKKTIAHRDLKHAIHKDLIFDPIEFKKIKEIFYEMKDCLNTTEKSLGLEQTSFLWLRDFNGATALLNYLKDSLIFREIRITEKYYTEMEAEEMQSKFYALKIK